MAARQPGTWRIVLVAALAFVAAPAFPQGTLTEADKKALLKGILEDDRHAIRRLVAEYASQQIDFLDISYIEPSNSANEGGLSVAYAWNAEGGERTISEDGGRFRMRRTAYGIDIDGKYAFGDAVNNADLSTAKLRFALERGDFGEIRVIENSSAFLDCLVELEQLVPTPADNAPDAEWDAYKEKAGPFEEACWVDNGVDQIARAFDSTYVFGIDFNGAVEGNQNFSERNVRFGLSSVYAAQPSSESSKYNVFDLPFRWLRNGFSENLNYVAPWPSIRLDIDRVDGSDNSMREALTTKSRYTRATGEVAFQSVLANIRRQPVRFNISYQHFYEVSAPAEIRAADMDSFGYLAMSLRFPARMIPVVESDSYELFVSYTSGQLPFDLGSEKAFELGFGTNISQLARLFDN